MTARKTTVRIPRPWLWALFAVPFASGALAADPFAHPVTDEAELRSMLSQPASKLRKTQVLTGQFRHSRQLREIPKPLIAEGEFTFARELGVFWHTRQPFDSVVVLTSTGLAQSDDGGPVQRISADGQPAVRLLKEIFIALFTLDTRTLARDFDLFGVEDQKDGRWVIGLRPRAGAIAGVFKEATVAGAGEVEQIVLVEARGDRTVIDLTGITYSSDPPGAAVRVLFALPPP